MNIVWSDPLWYANRSHYDVDGPRIARLEQEQAADGGYRAAQYVITTDPNEIGDWVEGGLGRHIETYDDRGEQVWEGFADEIQVRLGPLAFRIGPLMQVANRVSVIYTPLLDVTVSPAVTGTPTMTTIAEDANSQTRYGILEDVISGGTLMDDLTTTGAGTANEAEEVRDTYLSDRKQAGTSQQVAIGAVTEPELTIICRGYGAWFSRYVYTSGSVGVTTVGAKLRAIVGADPNGIFSTDYSSMASNALLAMANEAGNEAAQTIIDRLVAQGDANANRYIFGLRNRRKVYYQQVPDEITYFHRLSEGSQIIEDINGAIMEPWRVEAGRWMLVPDFLPGRAVPSSPYGDPRAIFIETVRYRAPYGLEINGGRVERISQLLAQKGVG